MKTLSIIGIIWATICFMFIILFNNRVDYEAGIGWGIFATFYLLAFSITALVKAIKK